LSAIVTTADQQLDPNTPAQQQTPVRIRSGYIEYDGLIYELHGLSATTDFPAYETLFDGTIRGFKELKDAAKINKKPEVITLKTVPSNMTLAAFFNQSGVPQERHEEFAVLNSMMLDAQVSKGTIVKLIKT
jgi:predicted Zn-dependent protease